MRLLIISGYWPSVSNSISGIFVVQQIAALARMGVRLSVIVPRTIGRSADPLISVSELGLDKFNIELVEVSIFKIPEKLSSFPGAIKLNTMLSGVMLKRVIRRLCGKYLFDGCIVHGARYGGLSLPFWYRQVQCGVAIVVHGVDPFLNNPDNMMRAHDLFQRAGVASNAVVLVGYPLKAHAVSVGFPVSKLRIVPNGTDLPPANLISPKQRSVTQTRVVVSVSNLVPLKGVDDNLRALAIISSKRPDLKWLYRIVGDGPYRGELEKLARDLGIDQRVEFLGRIAYRETMQEIEKGDIFALPSWGEAFGIVYLEAMARMKPVVACYENGAADFLTDGVEGLLVLPRDISGLADLLIKLLDDPGLCIRMGRSGREKAETMSWDENANRMLQILSEK